MTYGKIIRLVLFLTACMVCTLAGVFILWHNRDLWQRVEVYRKSVADLTLQEQALRKEQKNDRTKVNEIAALRAAVRTAKKDVKAVGDQVTAVQAEGGAMAPELRSLEDSLRRLQFDIKTAERFSPADAAALFWKTEEGLAKRKAELKPAELERRGLAWYAIRLAHLKLRMKKIDEAQRALADVPEDLRFWAWDHLQRQIRGDARSEVALDFDTTDAIATPDGKGLLIGGRGKVVLLVNAPGAVAEEVCAISGRVKLLAVDADSGRLAVLSQRDQGLFLELWDLKARRRLAETEVPKWIGPGQLSFAKGKHLLVLGGPDDAGRVWQTPQLKPVADFESLQLPLPLIQSVSLDATGTWWYAIAKTPPEQLRFGHGPTKKQMIRVADAKPSADGMMFLEKQYRSWCALPDGKHWIGAISGMLHFTSSGLRSSAVREAATHPLVAFTQSQQIALLSHAGALEIGDAPAPGYFSPLVLAPEPGPPHSLALLDNEQTVAVVCERQVVYYRGGAREESK